MATNPPANTLDITHSSRHKLPDDYIPLDLGSGPGTIRGLMRMQPTYPALVVGLLLDLIVNTFVATLIFIELPREWTVSARLTRHSEGGGWRQRVAIAIRTALLDNIDPNGVHRG